MKNDFVVKLNNGENRRAGSWRVAAAMLAGCLCAPLWLHAETPHAAPSAAPDERPLWRLLNDKKYRELEKEIGSMKSAHPGWKPPGVLVSLLKQNLLRIEIEDAIAKRDAGKIAELGKTDPEYFSCDHVDWAWALADARALLKEASLLQGLYRLIPECREADRLATLYKARKWLNDADYGLLLEREAKAKRSGRDEAEFERLRYEFSMAQLKTSNRDFKTELSRLSGDMARYRDAGAALFAAWHFFNQGDIRSASRWFKKALQWHPGEQDALTGLAYCALKEKRYEDALEIAKKLPHQGKLRRDALIGLAQEANGEGRYERAVKLFSEAEHAAELPRYAKSMYAWSQYRLGDAGDASNRFLALYQSSPDDESASGVFYSLNKADRTDELEKLGEEAAPNSKMGQLYGSQLYNEGQFLAARSKWPSKYADLGSVADTQGTLLAASRDKVGDGFYGLRITHVPVIDAGWAVGGAGQMNLRLDRVELNSGAPLYGTPLGTDYSGKLSPPASLSTRVSGVEPSLTWRDERSQVWVAEIGLTPSGGEIHQRPVGHLLRELDDPNGNYAFEIYREPERDSILSYTGLRDPYTGIVWGGVTRTGVDFSTLRSLDQGLNANFSVTGEELAGSGVSGNAHASFISEISRNLNWKGFKYAALGVSASFDHYSHNSYQFTLGQGGYFSPQLYWSAGPSLDFMTEEGGQYLVKAHFDVGSVYGRQDAFYAGSVPEVAGGGAKYDMQLNGVWRLNSHVQVGGMFAKRYAPQYSDNAAMLFIRFLVDPRSSVLSSDLAADVAQSLY